MRQLRHYALPILGVGYWMLFSVLAAFEARLPGYYPPSMRDQARELALRQPIPWGDVAMAAAGMAVLTAGLVLLLSRRPYARSLVAAYCAAVLFVLVISFPTDVGGVVYTLTKFGVANFVSLLFPTAWLTAVTHKEKSGAP